MYSSLLEVDIVADTPDGVRYVLTDHRRTTAMAAEPEITVLFALARLENARAHGAQRGQPRPTLVYACVHEPTAELREAVHACGAALETALAPARRVLPLAAVGPAELADRAFAGLADRVRARAGLRDPAAALRALEAEIAVDRPDPEADEARYWTRVLELAALAGEILRARYGGAWAPCDRSDVPFGFRRSASLVVMAVERARRVVEPGGRSSMFELLAGQAALAGPRVRPGRLLPHLRPRAEALREHLLYRPLLPHVPDDPALPVITYADDGSGALARELTPSGDDPLHAWALANLAAESVDVGFVSIGGVRVAVVVGGVASEKLLDRELLRALHAELGPTLACAVPRSGLLLATDAEPTDPRRAMAVLRAIADQEGTVARRLSSTIFLVQGGELVGQVCPPGAAADPAPARSALTPTRRRRAGRVRFLRRLLGRS